MLPGALQERLIAVVPLAVAVRPVGAPGTVVTAEPATWKTAESPYMGRVKTVLAIWELPLRGP